MKSKDSKIKAIKAALSGNITLIDELPKTETVVWRRGSDGILRDKNGFPGELDPSKENIIITRTIISKCPHPETEKQNR